MKLQNSGGTLWKSVTSVTVLQNAVFEAKNAEFHQKSRCYTGVSRCYISVTKVLQILRLNFKAFNEKCYKSVTFKINKITYDTTLDVTL